LGVIVFVQGLLISSYVGQQNTQLSGMITGGQQQLNSQQQFDQQNTAFLQDLLQYYQSSGDTNVIMILNRAGLNLQQQAPGAAAPAGTGAPVATPAPR